MLYLVGVGHAAPSTDGGECSLRETVLARMLAGYGLNESIQGALAETGAEGRGTSVVYALVDPARARVQFGGHGPRVSLLRVKDGMATLLRPVPALESSAQHMELRDGEALLFVAHHSLWDRYLLGRLDCSLLDTHEDWSEAAALRLCGRVPAMLEGDSASALLFRANQSQTGCRTFI
jgi:hypothetical protein